MEPPPGGVFFFFGVFFLPGTSFFESNVPFGDGCFFPT